MGKVSGSLKAGRFYSFGRPYRKDNPGIKQLLFRLKAKRIPHELLEEDDGRISILFYDSDDAKIQELCELSERFP